MRDLEGRTTQSLADFAVRAPPLTRQQLASASGQPFNAPASSKLLNAVRTRAMIFDEVRFDTPRFRPIIHSHFPRGVEQLECSGNGRNDISPRLIVIAPGGARRRSNHRHQRRGRG